LVGNQPQLEAQVERRGDPTEHPERVPVVVRVFEAGDGGLARADEVGKLLLGEPGPIPCVVDELGDLVACPFLVDHGAQLSVAPTMRSMIFTASAVVGTVPMIVFLADAGLVDPSTGPTINAIAYDVAAAAWRW